MAQHGGKRTPAHPAAVSGPGALSARTDGGPSDTQAHMQLPDAKYGEQANFQDIQAGSPLAGNPVAQSAPAPQVVPLGADTQRPDEPVTAGSPVGPGFGPTSAGIDSRDVSTQDADSLKPYLPMLEYLANRTDSSPSTRALIRRLKGSP